MKTDNFHAERAHSIHCVQRPVAFYCAIALLQDLVLPYAGIASLPKALTNLERLELQQCTKLGDIAMIGLVCALI